mgnify:CR=1 FL=1
MRKTTRQQGNKTTRLLALLFIILFQGSQLIARNSLLKGRLKDGNMNSRGLLSPRFFNDHILASAKTRIGNVGVISFNAHR